VYTIQYRRDVDLLDITWAGLFTPEDMNRYAEECRACWRREGSREGYRLRIVLSDDQPLPQGTLAVLADAFTDFPASCRTAMVTASAIAKMQIWRTMMVPHMEIFDTPEAALKWLMEAGAPN
jgi:hypothetical protein